jgi:Gpi18-like mannosyltransferase
LTDLLSHKEKPLNHIEQALCSKKGTAVFYLLFFGLLALNGYARWRGLSLVGQDMKEFLLPWYNIILQHGGFAALRDTSFSNYTPPYLYLLSLATYFPAIPSVIAIKIYSITFDVVCALVIFFIAHCFLGKRSSWLVALIVLLLPTVWVDSAWWGQCDSIFTAFLLLTVLFILKGKPWWVMVMFTIAFAFKFQAIFLAPFILLMFLTRKIPWRSLTIVPAVFLLMMLPIFVAGQPVLNSLTIYLKQTDSYQLLTKNAPSIYAFFSSNSPAKLGWIGFFLAGVGTLIYLWIGWKQRNQMTQERMIELALISFLVLPFLLPRMHERYYYSAALFAIPLVCARPRLLVIPFALQLTTLLSYFPYLYGKEIFPLWILAVINLGIIIALIIYWLTQNRTGKNPKLIGFDSKTAG